MDAGHSEIKEPRGTIILNRDGRGIRFSQS